MHFGPMGPKAHVPWVLLGMPDAENSQASDSVGAPPGAPPQAPPGPPTVVWGVKHTPVMALLHMAPPRKSMAKHWRSS